MKSKRELELYLAKAGEYLFIDDYKGMYDAIYEYKDACEIGPSETLTASTLLPSVENQLECKEPIVLLMQILKDSHNLTGYILAKILLKELRDNYEFNVPYILSDVFLVYQNILLDAKDAYERHDYSKVRYELKEYLEQTEVYFEKYRTHSNIFNIRRMLHDRINNISADICIIQSICQGSISPTAHVIIEDVLEFSEEHGLPAK